jgi:IclR family KDG regulon transcriptional repressor
MDSTIAKGMAVLELLSICKEPLSLREISEVTGLGKSNAHRTLRTFVELGYVRQVSAKGAYMLTTKLWEQGVRAMLRLDFVRIARPHLVRLCDETGESTLLAIVDGDDAVYLDRVMSKNAITVYSQIGARVPAWCNASGRVIMAFNGAHRPDALNLQGYTSKSIRTREALGEELTRIRAQGHSMTCEEWQEGVYGLAAPIRDHAGNVVASISVTGATSRLTEDMLRTLREGVVSRAAAISKELGLD